MIETPAASAAVRGTGWMLGVEGARTTRVEGARARPCHRPRRRRRAALGRRGPAPDACRTRARPGPARRCRVCPLLRGGARRPVPSVVPPDPERLADTPERAIAESFIAAYLGDFPQALAILRGTLPASFIPIVSESASAAATVGLGRAFADVLVPIGPDWRVQAGVTGVTLSGEDVDIGEIDGRAGIAWAPADWTWSRAGVSRETEVPTAVGLAPQTTVGLMPTEAPVAFGGTADALMARWDAE